MTMCEGPGCSTAVRELPHQGRPPRFCSNACRQREYRARKARPVSLPDTLASRKSWTRRDGKRPITIDGRPASSTDPATWASFDAVQSGAGDGFGIMLGMGLGCYDLDHCLDGGTVAQWALDAIASITEPIHWVERSMSGDGLHIFVSTRELRGYRRNGVEFYPRARFIAVTGDRFTL